MEGIRKYELRRMTPADFPAMQYLFQTVYQRKYSLEYLAKKYDAEFGGLKHLTWFAFHEGKPVSVYGALPFHFKQQNNSFLGVQTCDSFTLEAHQRKGLYRDMAGNVFEEVRKAGAAFVYGYHSMPGTVASCRKLGWSEGPLLRGYWVKTGAFPRSKFRNFLSPDTLPKSIQKLKTTTPFHNSFHDSEFLHLDYDSSFFEYKTFTPNTIIQCGKAEFWVKTGSILMIGDGRAETLEDLKIGLFELKKLAGKAGFDRILFQLHPESPLCTILDGMGTPFDSWLVGSLVWDEKINWSKWRGNFGDIDTF